METVRVGDMEPSRMGSLILIIVARWFLIKRTLSSIDKRSDSGMIFKYSINDFCRCVYSLKKCVYR